MSEILLFVDAEVFSAMSTNNRVLRDSNLVIGALSFDSEHSFYGSLDEIWFYSSAISVQTMNTTFSTKYPKYISHLKIPTGK
jgi:hypothetical protein